MPSYLAIYLKLSIWNNPLGLWILNTLSMFVLLQESLYGLKQAPRAWNERFSKYLLAYGFLNSVCDTSMFIYQKGDARMTLLVYVDDIILVGSLVALMNSFIGSLKTEFSMKDLGLLDYFLGIEVTYGSTSKKLLLTQNKYSLEILKKHDMMGCKPCKTPVSQGQRASVCDGTLLSDVASYRSLVGSLQYLTLTRPDISYAVNYVSQFLHCPTDVHLQLSIEVYQGITLSAGNGSELQDFSDSDWAGCPDTRKSTSGYCVFVGGNLVSWSSKKQQTISRSSTEAEYRGLANAAAEILWLSYLFEELLVHLSFPCKLFCDNQGAVSLTANPTFHARNKHIEVDYHMIRDLVRFGFIRVSYIHTSHQVADIFTKGLSKSQFSLLKSKLMPVVRTSV
ncbi:uncharacterized protein LOC113350971 [Papaver somniferum]|uniref:uncharacterized protein LOC113350971 n=1 Tax=Papaver somniferum TaxID=3469 RepID=UPI000E7051BF|nr:uncharacterized protein LOC113350971 [Papaver somniferum]